MWLPEVGAVADPARTRPCPSTHSRAVSVFLTTNEVLFTDITHRKGGRVAIVHQTLLSQPSREPLALFDLSEAEIYEQIVYPTMAAVDQVSPMAPPGERGKRFYGEAVTNLRRVLLPKEGWEIEQGDGVARTVHAGKRLAIVVASGNAWTGREDGRRELTTEWDKGAQAFANATRYKQAGFDDISDSFPTIPTVIGKWDLWYLLHKEVDGGELRLELSRPGDLDSSGFPRLWLERIIMEPFRLEPQVVLDQDDDDEDGDATDVDVPVNRNP